MKYEEALRIIRNYENKGFMVSFEHKRDGMLGSDYFPDKHAGEKLIETEKEAWVLARKFADATEGRCVNIYVVDSHFMPVRGYQDKEIKNR